MTRIVLYSHDTLGLGHFRRCLKLAWALSERLVAIEGAFLSGSPWTDAFDLPPGFRIVHLPPAVKVGHRRYAPRQAGFDLEELVSRRSATIRQLLADFAPDLFLVDNVPGGMHGEVRAALGALGAQQPTAVLMLRDILDEPVAALREWRLAGATRTVDDLFQEVWCFGDQEDVAALVEQGPLGNVSTPVVTCGHLGYPPSAEPAMKAHRDTAGERAIRDVLVTAGGGADGGPLVESCAAALRYLPEVRCRMVPGPDFPRESEARVRSLLPPDAVLDRFAPDLDSQFQCADLVVAMAGYNTVTEILASGCRALLSPRTRPRSEQLIRARRLASRGRAGLLTPEDLEPRRLARRIEAELEVGSRFPAEIQPGGWIAAERAARLLSLAPVREVV